MFSSFFVCPLLLLFDLTYALIVIFLTSDFPFFFSPLSLSPSLLLSVLCYFSPFTSISLFIPHSLSFSLSLNTSLFLSLSTSLYISLSQQYLSISLTLSFSLFSCMILYFILSLSLFLSSFIGTYYSDDVPV